MAVADRRAGVGLVVLVVCLALAALGSGGAVSQAATRCSNQTVDGGRFVGKLTLRVVRLGHVSCAKAHRVVRAYYRKMAAGECGELNNFCALSFPGGWSCSIFSFGVSQTAGGAMAGCARGTPKARIRLYNARGGAQARAAATIRGTVLSTNPQTVTHDNDDGTVTKCGILGGVLRTEQGQTFTFAAGGVLAPDFAPQVRATIDAIIQAGREGPKLVATLTYVDSQMLCGYRLEHFVTGVSLAAVPPAPPPAPQPPPQPPPPVVRTASGTIARMSPLGALVIGRGYCRIWPGTLATAAGERIDFSVETALTGSLDTELTPADPTAAKRASDLLEAAFLGRKASVRITYAGPFDACGKPLAAVVTAADVKVSQRKRKLRGRIEQVLSPVVDKTGTTTCKTWTGWIITRSGKRVPFHLATVVRGFSLRPPDRHAARLAKQLRKASRKRALTTIRITGPVFSCGYILPDVVTRASVRRR